MSIFDVISDGIVDIDDTFHIYVPFSYRAPHAFFTKTISLLPSILDAGEKFIVHQRNIHHFFKFLIDNELVRSDDVNYELKDLHSAVPRLDLLTVNDIQVVINAVNLLLKRQIFKRLLENFVLCINEAVNYFYRIVVICDQSVILMLKNKSENDRDLIKRCFSRESLRRDALLKVLTALLFAQDTDDLRNKLLSIKPMIDFLLNTAIVLRHLKFNWQRVDKDIMIWEALDFWPRVQDVLIR